MSAVDLTPEQVNARFAELAGRTNETVRCQCDQHHKPCTGTAEVIVELHLLGACNGPEADKWGNRVELLCMSCARSLWIEASMLVARYRAAAQRVGGVPACESCSCPIVNPSDLMRSVKHIPGGVR